MVQKRKMMLIDQYKIEGTINLDEHPCFSDVNTYPFFQEDLESFKRIVVKLVSGKQNKTFYKFGDGDYYFLKKEAVGSATPGKRALGKPYDQINIHEFRNGAIQNDFCTVEIYPENRKRFKELFPKTNIDFPAEYGYGLVANKWFFETFKGKIGLIGATEKLEIIKELLKHKEYQNYLKLENFNDYISIPQKFACDDVDAVEKMVGEQLAKSSSDIFLVGIGHVKSALTHRFKKYKNAVYLDVGSGIDAIAGIVDIGRPYFGDWTNYQMENYDYGNIDFLQYRGDGKHFMLKKQIDVSKKVNIEEKYFKEEEIRVNQDPYCGYFEVLDETFNLNEIQSFCDVGCATGLLLNEFDKRRPNIEIAGLEYFSWHKDEAPNSIKEKILICDIRDEVKLDKKFDIVNCTEVGEHIDKGFTDAFLNNLKKLSKKYVVMSWANSGGENDREHDAHCQHLNPLSKDEFEALMLKNNFIKNNELTEKIYKNSLNKNNFYFWWRQSLSVWEF